MCDNAKEYLSIFNQVLEAYKAENVSPVINEESHTGCKHEFTLVEDYIVFCEQCHIVLKDRIPEGKFITEGSQMNYKSANPPHCTFKYFQRKIQDFDIEYDREQLLANFIIQEGVIDQIFFNEDYEIKRQNSLNVKYNTRVLLILEFRY